MRTLSKPTAAILIVALAGVIQAGCSSSAEPILDAADTEAQLAVVLREIEAETAADGLARGDKQRRIRGAMNFFQPFPGGNGRSCATCHDPRDGFALSPATVEARWQRLQQARRANPQATDPLFRPIDADDGGDDFTLLRTRALVKVRVPLPARVRLADDPRATHVTVSRAVPPLNMLKHTAPYHQDRSAAPSRHRRWRP